jgi:hypothetical protein
MTEKEIIDVLRPNIGKRVRVTFEDGVTQSIDISSVDEEGFVHSGPNGDNPDGFWSRFEGVIAIETQPSN